MDFTTKLNSFQKQEEKIAFILEQWERLKTHRQQHEICETIPQLLGEGWIKNHSCNCCSDSSYDA